ncbi:MAG TPA: Hpt domain-containing protein [Ktedonobacterales bacterium]|nr:Hpt domain-containing protein [Ktedonobacterales bacterium]
MSSEGFDKSTIVNSFLDEVSAYIPEIEAHLDRLQIAPGDSEAVEEAYRRTHTISGSAAMMDFSGLAHIAQGMEVILDGALEQGAMLDAPTVALLRRSCGRLDRVARLIRSGGSDAEIVAEDDQDHSAYRGPSAAASAPASHPPLSGGGATGTPSSPWNAAPPPGSAQAALQATQIPDWLAAFGPSAPAQAGGPQTPRLPVSDDLAIAGASQAGLSSTAPRPAESVPTVPRSTDRWNESLTNLPTGVAPTLPTQPPAFAGSSGMGAPGSGGDRAEFIESQATTRLPVQSQPAPGSWERSAPSQGMAQFAPASQPIAAPAPAGMALPPGASSALDAMRADEETVRRQAAALRDTVEMLREAAQAMESERGQLQSFLDGSHDALERLEEWVGQQMNLDLRNSPEAVRAYLPLSVIWVTTTRLKKLITLLTSAGRNLTVTQEQMDEALAEFRSSLETLARFTNLFTSGAPAPDGGYTATVAQITWGGPSAPNQPSAAEGLPVGQRADLERAVREELRRSLEDEVRQDIAADIRREEEQRIRQELEVQLRRQMMFSSLGVGMGESSVTVRDGAVEVRPQPRAGRRTQVTTEQSPEALEVFREEAAEHLRTITSGIADLERAPGDMQTIQAVRRATHTLKGAAGMMGFVIIQRVAHASEDLLDQLAEKGRGLSPEELALLFETAETLDQLISGAIVGSQQQRETAQALIDRYGAITGRPVESLPDESAPSAEDAAPEAEEPPARAPSDDLSVRIRLSRLDELVNLFGELLVNRSIYEERVGRLNRLVEDSTNASERLRDVGAQLERRFATFMLPSGQQQPHAGPLGGLPALNMPNMPGSLPPAPWGPASRPMGSPSGGQAGVPEHLRGFDALEMDRYDEFHRLSGILGEIVNDEVALSREMSALIRELQVAFARETRLSSEVQDRLLKARLVPIRTLAPRLYRASRNSARREGKEIEFFLEGGDTEVDRKIVEEVEGPLLHLVRNSVNHGIERPEERLAAGKPRAGRIVVSATYEGNQVLIEVQDDGRGIDPTRLRETAVARGWVDAYATLSDREALNLIFQPGVSTAQTVTEESGRGVGLDVVRDAAARLKGSVEVESNIGAGSIFSLRFPISLQIARAVLVKVSNSVYAIPMAVVDQIGRLDYYERVSAPVPAVVVRGEQYTLVRLSTLLHLPPSPVEERASLLIVNAGRRRVALLVDGIVAQQEIVAKPLGSHLRNVRGVAGATALGNGQVVVILELLELLATPVRDDITLPEPGSGRRDTLPSAAVPVAGMRNSAPRPAVSPSGPPPGQPIPKPQPRPGSAGADAPPAFPQAGRPSPSWSGFPQPGQPVTPAPPFVGSSGGLDSPSTPQWSGSSEPRRGMPSTPLPPFLQPGGPSGGQSPRPASGPAEDTTSLLPPRPLPLGEWATGAQRAVAGPGPQRAAPTGSSRDFVVETDGRRTVTSLPSKPSYVLVVDDSPSVRTVVTGMLKANGWETQSARDGIEALDIIGRKRPAAVLLDIEMPRMDGYELMATLRSDPQYRSLPLVVLTSRAADKHRLRAQQLGANAYVVKPYKDQSLLETIAGLVRKEQSGAL